MEEIMIFWMVLLILCIGIEVLTLGLTTIWFAAGALVAIFAALLQAPIFVQVILFLVVSLLSLFFTRPIAVKYFNKDRVKTNVESMVGRQAIVTGEIDNLQAAGQVTVSGQEWSARSWDDKVKIPVGTVVVVAAISGVKLIVRTEQQFADMVQAGQEGSGLVRDPRADGQKKPEAGDVSQNQEPKDDERRTEQPMAGEAEDVQSQAGEAEDVQSQAGEAEDVQSQAREAEDVQSQAGEAEGARCQAEEAEEVQPRAGAAQGAQLEEEAAKPMNRWGDEEE